MKRLYRSRKDRMIAGICGGIGEMLSIDPTIVRLAYVILTLFTGIVPMTIVYIAGWIIIPEAPEQ